MVRYGIIGSGMMGQEHIRNIRLLDGAAITGIADPNEQMRMSALNAAGGGATVFADYRDLLSADLCDAYVVASPNDRHHEQMLDLLPGNKPVLVEKPLCTTAADCRDVIAHVNGRTAPVWVAMEYRYMPPVERLRKETREGSRGHAADDRDPGAPVSLPREDRALEPLRRAHRGHAGREVLPLLGPHAASGRGRSRAGLCVGRDGRELRGRGLRGAAGRHPRQRLRRRGFRERDEGDA
jgi:predicted dehydrogenase